MQPIVPAPAPTERRHQYWRPSRFDLDGYVTHALPLDGVEEAFRIRLHCPAESLKVIVTPPAA